MKQPIPSFLALVTACMPLHPLPAAEMETDDGLYLRYRDSTGELLAFMNGTSPIGLHVTDGKYATFSVVDAARPERSAAIAVKNARPAGEAARFEGGSQTAQLRIAATIRAEWNCVRVELEAEDLSGEERALTIRHQFPVDAAGWAWWDDVETSRTIEKGRRYVRYDRETRGNYPVCWHPLGTIAQAGGHHALTIAVPFEPGTMARVGYDGDFFIEIDAGLSPHTKLPGKSRFVYCLYTSDPAWGFRAAVEKYYALFPTYFTKRVNREGTWVARTPTQKISHPEDYLITFHEVSTVMTNAVPFDNKSGIYALRYDMPHWIGVDMPGRERPSQAEINAFLEKAAADSDHPEHAKALLALRTGARNPQGELRVNINPKKKGPAGGQWLAIEPNLDPDLPVAPDGLNCFASWQKDHFPKLMSMREGRYDGQYIDSAEFMVEGMDHAPEHFAYADYNLGWSASLNHPGIPTAVAKFEYLKKESDLLHSLGKLMMSNFTPWRCGFYLTVFDINGTEVWEYDWARLAEEAMKHGARAEDLKRAGVGEAQMEEFRRRAEEIEEGPSDSFVKITDWRREDMMYYRRFASYQKPYLLLLKLMNPVDVAVFGLDRYREYLDWGLFFGIYPACSEAIWSAPKEFLDLYRKYMPVCRAIGTAGWEPVTHARASDRAVRVERFGYSLQQTLHFTVRNFSGNTAEFDLAIDRKALNVPPGSRLADAFTGEALETQENGETLRTRLTLEAGHTTVVRVFAGEDHSAPRP